MMLLAAKKDLLLILETSGGANPSYLVYPAERAVDALFISSVVCVIMSFFANFTQQAFIFFKLL